MNIVQGPHGPLNANGPLGRRILAAQARRPVRRILPWQELFAFLRWVR